MAVNNARWKRTRRRARKLYYRVYRGAALFITEFTTETRRSNFKRFIYNDPNDRERLVYRA